MRLDRSPLKEAMDYWAGGATEVSVESFAAHGRVYQPPLGGRGAPTYLEEGGPAAALGRLRILLCGVGHFESVCVQCCGSGRDALEVSPGCLVYAAEGLSAV